MAGDSFQTLEMANEAAMTCFVHGHAQMDSAVQMGNLPSLHGVDSTAVVSAAMCINHAKSAQNEELCIHRLKDVHKVANVIWRRAGTCFTKQAVGHGALGSLPS